MSMLTVATHFEAIGELAEGLADRVEDGRIVLYGPDAYEEGDSIGFEILLADGSQALHGRGMVTECIDGGEERDPEVRYDVVLAGLQLEGASEMVYERMIDVRGGSLVAPAPEPAEEAAPEPEPAAEAAPEEVPEAAPDEPPADFGDEKTTVGTLDDVGAIEAAAAAEPEPEPQPDAADDELPASTPEFGRGANVAEPAEPAAPVLAEERGLAPPNPPQNPGGFDVALDLQNDTLERAVREPAGPPAAPEREPSAESTGLFQYGGPVPIPTRPPRPAIDASQRVARAPALTTEEAYRAMRASLGFHPPAPGESPAPYESAFAQPEHVEAEHAAVEDVADLADATDASDVAADEIPEAEEAVADDVDLDGV